MLVYNISFPLLRAAGNTGSHCNTTRLCLCGLLTLLEQLQSSPCRQTLPGCSSRGQAEVTPVTGACTTAPLQPLPCPSRPWAAREAEKALWSCWQRGSCKCGWAEVGRANSGFLHLPTSSALTFSTTGICPRKIPQYLVPGVPLPLPTGLEFAESNF